MANYKLLGNTYTTRKGDDTKLKRIDAILKQNPTHKFEGTYLKGMKELGKVQPKKVQAIMRATSDLEKKFKCKIKWSKMKWHLVITTARYSHEPAGIGSVVEITGKTDDGRPAKYKYNQPASQEGGSRHFMLGDKRGSNSDFT